MRSGVAEARKSTAA